MKSYVKFLTEEIQPILEVDLVRPSQMETSPSIRSMKMVDCKVREIVNVEILDYYTRSIKFKFTWDKYEAEKLIYVEMDKGPTANLNKIWNTAREIINAKFIEDGRINEIIGRFIRKEEDAKLHISRIFKDGTRTSIGNIEDLKKHITKKI